MKSISCVLLLTLMSCSSNKIIPKNVKEISNLASKRCDFVDDLSIKGEGISDHKLKFAIQKYAAERSANAYVINEIIKNGSSVAVTGSVFHCSK